MNIVFEDAEILVVDKPAGSADQHRRRGKAPNRPGDRPQVRRAIRPESARRARFTASTATPRGCWSFPNAPSPTTHSRRSSSSTPSIAFTQPPCRANPIRRKGRSIRAWSSAPTERSTRPTAARARASGRSRITRRLRHEASTSRRARRLQTGRKHQIRVHLSERGCPIVGRRGVRPGERRLATPDARRRRAGVRPSAHGQADVVQARPGMIFDVASASRPCIGGQQFFRTTKNRSAASWVGAGHK